MASFSCGAATLFVDTTGASFVEFSGPSASMGETGGPLGSLDDLINDPNLHAWIRDKFDETTLRDAISEARRLSSHATSL